MLEHLQQQARTILHDFRTRFRLTQKEMAEWLEVRPNTIACWERGVVAIQHPRLLMLALSALASRGEERIAGMVERSMHA